LLAVRQQNAVKLLLQVRRTAQRVSLLLHLRIKYSQVPIASNGHQEFPVLTATKDLAIPNRTLGTRHASYCPAIESSI